MGEYKVISNHLLSNRAVEYFGGDVQRFTIYRKGQRPYGYYFEIWQEPHWGNRRLAAMSYATTQREALAEFNEMARLDDRENC